MDGFVHGQLAVDERPIALGSVDVQPHRMLAADHELVAAVKVFAPQSPLVVEWWLGAAETADQAGDDGAVLPGREPAKLDPGGAAAVAGDG